MSDPGQSEIRDELCPHATHIAPDPTNGQPTSCPCGRVRKFPPPPKENPPCL